MITDATGAVVEKTDYLPYGETFSGGNDRFLYTGKEKDADTGLYYYGARYYDPSLTNFIQPDTITPDIYDPQSLNRYSYVKRNPYRYVDPTGQWGEDVHRDMTYNIMLRSGLPEQYASRLSYVNQFVDNAASTKPGLEGYRRDYVGGTDATREWHFQSRSSAEQKLTQAIKEGDTTAFGMYLHTYQDTYSHEGLTPETHGLLITLPDSVRLRPREYTETYKGTEAWINNWIEAQNYQVNGQSVSPAEYFSRKESARSGGQATTAIMSTGSNSYEYTKSDGSWTRAGGLISRCK